MSYYIALQSESLTVGEVVAFCVVKRLKDFKARDGVLYHVFKSKKDIDDQMFVPVYMGKNGKLKKQPSAFVLRF